jgi:hypothetical protein
MLTTVAVLKIGGGTNAGQIKVKVQFQVLNHDHLFRFPLNIWLING